MSPDSYTQAEIVRSLERIEAEVREVKKELKTQPSAYVARGEFEAWRDGLGREIRDIKDDLDSRTVPWTAVGSLVVSVMTLAVVLIQVIPAT